MKCKIENDLEQNLNTNKINIPICQWANIEIFGCPWLQMPDFSFSIDLKEK